MSRTSCGSTSGTIALKNGRSSAAPSWRGITGLACIGINGRRGLRRPCSSSTPVLGCSPAWASTLSIRGRTPIYVKAGKSESSLQVKIRFRPGGGMARIRLDRRARAPHADGVRRGRLRPNAETGTEEVNGLS